MAFLGNFPLSGFSEVRYTKQRPSHTKDSSFRGYVQYPVLAIVVALYNTAELTSLAL